MQCTKCGSDNTQRLQVVHEHGTQNISTTSSTVGGGYGGSFGAGAAHTKTEGTSQSTMAQKSAPPSKKTFGFCVGLIFVGLLCFGGGVGWGAFGLLLIAAGGLGIKNALDFNGDQWPQLFKTWEESWVCNKCGHFYHQIFN